MVQEVPQSGAEVSKVQSANEPHGEKFAWLKKLFAGDNLLIGVCSTLVCVFGYLGLVADQQLESQAKGESVASIAAKKSNVKRKQSDALVWNKVDRDDELFDGDQIFTQDDSTARVAFLDGTEIVVSENSLITIEKRDGKTTIDMSKGFISGDFSSSKNDVAIKMGGTNINLEKGAQIQIKVDPNNASASQIALESGKASFKDASGKEVGLDNGEVLSVNKSTGKSEIKKLPIRLQEPASGEQFIRSRSTDAVRFSWSAGETDSAFSLVVARDAGFRNLIGSYTTKNQFFSIKNLPGGQIYWKVTTNQNGNISSSFDRQFGVVDLAPVVLNSPAPATKIRKIPNEPNEIVFIWKKSDLYPRYRYQLAQSPTFAKVEEAKELSGNSLPLTLKTAGTWHWRVGGVTADGKKGPWSTTNSLVLENLPDLPAPKLLAPDVATEISWTEFVRVGFKWQTSEQTVKSIVQISDTKSFADDRTQEFELTNSYLDWEPNGAGTRFWRVRQEDSYGRKSKFSRARRFLVKVGSPEPIVPEQNQLFIIDKKDMNIDFQWGGVKGASNYVVEIARDRSFKKKVVTLDGVNDKAIWSNVKSGVFYWRVVGSTSGGKKSSKPMTIKVAELEKVAPPTLRDRYYFVIPQLEDGSAFQKIHDFWNSLWTAYAADGDRVLIEWLPVESASGYKLEMARDRKFEDVVYRTETTRPELYWKNAKPGFFYLRAQSLNALGEPGKYSKTSTVSVNLKAPVLFKPAQGEMVNLTSGKISFKWQRPVNAVRTVIQVARDNGFKDLVLEKKFEVQSDFEWKSSKVSGQYYWRVGTSYHRRNPMEWSNANRFRSERSLLDQVVLSTTADVIEISEPKGEVRLEWGSVKGAKSYLVKVLQSGNPSGKPVEVADTEYNPILPEGDYSVSVLAASPLFESPEPSISTIKVRRLLPPVSISGQERVLFYKQPPPVLFKWKKIKAASNYRWRLYQGNAEIRSGLEDTGKLKFTDLQVGNYRLEVEAISKLDYPGEKAAFEFGLSTKELDKPELVFPAEGEELTRRARLNFVWDKNKAYSAYNLVVATDPEFKNIVHREKDGAGQQKVQVKPDQKYYWYVEGEAKQEKYAMRSDIRSFKVSKYTGAATESVRLLLAFSPSLVKNVMIASATDSQEQVGNSVDVPIYNSFVLEGQYWFGRNFGFEGAYHRKSRDLFDTEQQTSASTDQETLTFNPQELALRGLYRLPFSLRPGSPEFLVRAGYLYKSFFTYYSVSRTALGLVESGTNNISIGLGGKIPVIGKNYLESGFDFNVPFNSLGTEVESGNHYRIDLGYYLQYTPALKGGLGYRYGKGSYEFFDELHELQGSLLETTHSVLASLGYGF